MKAGKILFVLAIIGIVAALAFVAPKVLDAQAKNQISNQVATTALTHVKKIDQNINQAPNYRATTTAQSQDYTVVHSNNISLQTRTSDQQIVYTTPQGTLTYIPTEQALIFEPPQVQNIATRNANVVLNAFTNTANPKITQKITQQYQMYVLKTPKTNYVIRLNKEGDASTWIETIPKDGFPVTSAKTDFKFLERSVNISADAIPDYPIHTPNSLLQFIQKHFPQSIEFLTSPNIPYDSQAVILDQCIRENGQYGFLILTPFPASYKLPAKEDWLITYKIPANNPQESESQDDPETEATQSTPDLYLTYLEASAAPISNSIEFTITPTSKSARPIQQNHVTEDIPRRSQIMREASMLLYLFTEAKSTQQPHRAALFKSQPIPDQLPTNIETLNLSDIGIE